MKLADLVVIHRFVVSGQVRGCEKPTPRLKATDPDCPNYYCKHCEAYFPPTQFEEPTC